MVTAGAMKVFVFSFFIRLYFHEPVKVVLRHLLYPRVFYLGWCFQEIMWLTFFSCLIVLVLKIPWSLIILFYVGASFCSSMESLHQSALTFSPVILHYQGSLQKQALQLHCKQQWRLLIFLKSCLLWKKSWIIFCNNKCWKLLTYHAYFFFTVK